MSRLALTGIAAVLGAGALCPICDGAFRPAVAAAATTTPARADTAQVRLTIRGMTCGSCATTARIALQRIPGVYRATVSYDSSSAVVLYDPARTSPPVFIARLKDMTGYEAHVADERRGSGT